MRESTQLSNIQLCEYIEKNNLEYDAVVMLVFNTCDFKFVHLTSLVLNMQNIMGYHISLWC